MAQSEAARLRAARFEDCSQVAALTMRYDMGSRSAATWRHLWDTNPALIGRRTVPDMGWVLERDGTIGGYLGNVPLRYRFGDHDLLAAAATAFVVDPQFRGQTLELVAAYLRQPHVDLLLNTSANEPAGKIFKALRARPMPQAAYADILSWPLRPEQVARALLRRRGLSTGLASLGGRLLGPFLWANRQVRQKLPQPRPGLDLTVTGVAGIDDAFDALWQRKCAETPRLLAVRSAAVLRWHFSSEIYRPPVQIVHCRNQGQLLGYLVLQRSDTPRIGLARTRVVDLVAADDAAEVVEALMFAACQAAQADGSHVLELIGLPAHLRAPLLATRPYRRLLEPWPFYYQARAASLVQALTAPSAWYPTLYDGDSSL